MPAGALGLALGAAALHATWNLLLARARDTRAANSVMLLVAVVAWAPAALLSGGVHTAAAPYIAASAALELGYFALLSAAYADGELSVVYPIARGGAPLLVALASAAGAGGGIGPLQALGVVAIAGGVVAVRGVRGPWRGRDTLLAAATAACIAGYTVVDRYGVRHADPLAYLWIVLAPVAIAYAVATARARRPGALRAALDPATVVAGIGTFGSYVLVLAALRLAAAAPVAAVRETSVLLAVALASVVLGERVGRARMAGAAVVVAGIALVAAG